MRAVVLGVVLFLSAVSGAAAETVTVAMPESQVRFIEVMVDFSARYKAEKNELRATKLVQRRYDALEKIPNSQTFSGWYAQIADMGTSGGAAWVVLKLKEYPFTLKTWNNALSDSRDKTMLKTGTPVYEALSEMDKGAWVQASGSIVAEGSMTEKGMMTDPEWVVRFSNIGAVSAK